jgi:hypothetical protein
MVPCGQNERQWWSPPTRVVLSGVFKQFKKISPIRWHWYKTIICCAILPQRVEGFWLRVHAKCSFNASKFISDNALLYHHFDFQVTPIVSPRLNSSSPIKINCTVSIIPPSILVNFCRCPLNSRDIAFAGAYRNEVCCA